MLACHRGEPLAFLEDDGPAPVSAPGINPGRGGYRRRYRGSHSFIHHPWTLRLGVHADRRDSLDGSPRLRSRADRMGVRELPESDRYGSSGSLLSGADNRQTLRFCRPHGRGSVPPSKSLASPQNYPR